MDGKGVRLNKNKLRLDLVPTSGTREVAKVLEKGLLKYDENNWKRGMKWTTVLASLERHLMSFKEGEDFDKESGLLHVAHIACNAMFLIEYYSTYPQGDNRSVLYKVPKRIGINIDNIVYDLSSVDMISLDKQYWSSLPAIVDLNDMYSTVCMIVTTLNIPDSWLRDILQLDTSVSICKQSDFNADSCLNVDMFVDVDYTRFCMLNNNGVFCWLYDHPRNKKYDVGYKRIDNFKDL
jgi:hypothetical protein